MPSTAFVLIRHGQIRANIERRWHGETDSPLTPRGEEQARRLGAYFKANGVAFDAMYASPLGRTRITAELIAGPLDLVPVVDARLREYSIGTLEDTPYEELAKGGFFQRVAADVEYAPGGGDSVADVEARMAHLVCDLDERHGGERVALVGHGAAFGVLLASLLTGRPFPFSGYHTDNTAYSKLVMAPLPRLVYFNRTPHLAG